jgi:hypothetical protein
VLRIVNVFDRDGDGTVDMDEFLSFTGRRSAKVRGEVDMRLRDVCVWETTCHLLGMANAYQVVCENDQLRRIELPEHEKRRAMPAFKVPVSFYY